MSGPSIPVCSTVCGMHEICCCDSKVQISAEGIKVLSVPTVEYCPLHEALYGTMHVDDESVRKSVQMKIKKHGFCCENRRFDSESVVLYGASEMMRVWLEEGLIDCAVIVCEGAGTVIATQGKLVQAIGARLTGIIKTSPISQIIEHIEAEGGLILDKQTARIDQIAGVKHAHTLGYKRIAVSVAGFQANVISKIRKVETATRSDVLIFSVCNTSVRRTSTRHIAKADITCASASRILRTGVGKKALLQLGVTIPVYALTEKGKKLILAYLAEFKQNLVIFRTDRLPYQVEGKGPVLKAEISRSV